MEDAEQTLLASRQDHNHSLQSHFRRHEQSRVRMMPTAVGCTGAHSTQLCLDISWTCLQVHLRRLWLRWVAIDSPNKMTRASRCDVMVQEMSRDCNKRGTEQRPGKWLWRIQTYSTVMEPLDRQGTRTCSRRGGAVTAERARMKGAPTQP